MGPLISVVMPVFNGERFLALAVESVLAQTLGDFEYVIVDDGSTDGTGEILDRYRRRDSRIVVHRMSQNTGLRVALNTGCEIARSDIIARMDADDVSLPRRFEEQHRFLQHNPMVGVLGTAVQTIDENDVPGPVWQCPVQPGLTAWSLLFFCSLAHPAIMMRRTVLERAGLYPQGCVGGTEDYALFTKIWRTDRLANLPDVLLRYRVWKSNMSHAGWDRQQNDGIRIMREMVHEVAQVDLSVDDARSLRGLMAGRYPSTMDEAQRLGALIPLLRDAYIRAGAFVAEDVDAINADAGVRLLMLSAVAAKTGAFHVAGRLLVRALRLSPRAPAEFTRKFVRRFTSPRTPN